MVLALEPAWYGEEEGVRLEWVVLVTEDGCQVLSNHELEL
jgi:Xaa-Pro aminopeptidase